MSQLRKYLFIFLLVVAILFPFVFYSTDAGERRDLSLIERLAYAFITPINEGVGGVAYGLKRWVQSYVELYDAKKDLIGFREENARLRIENHTFKALAAENARLRQLLGLVHERELKFRSCELISSDPSFLYKNIRIGCGTEDKVTQGMGVVAAEGVVGVVMRVTHRAADVLLLTDPNSNLDVIVSRNRRRGVLSGSLGNAMQFKYSDRGSKVLVGDEVVTSGLTGPFPPGIPVGRVAKISQDVGDGTLQSMDIEPFVDVGQASEVLVLLQASREVDLIRSVVGEDGMNKVVEGLRP